MFALADCNNFFASCECVFRPDLQGKPVIVLSNNDIARSNNAKRAWRDEHREKDLQKSFEAGKRITE